MSASISRQPKSDAIVAGNVHRNEVLTSTALEFMRAWVEVMASDMDSQSVHKLQSLMDTNVRVHFWGGLDCASHQAQGYAGVEQRLRKEKERCGASVEHSVCILGTNEESDVVFLLMESKPAGMGGYNRWGSAGIPGVPPAAMADFARDYCRARSSAHFSTHTLSKRLDDSFEVYDQLGMLPLLVNRGETPDHAKSHVGVMDEKVLMERLSKLMAKYDVQTCLEDFASSRDANIGFVHWESELTLKPSHSSASGSQPSASSTTFSSFSTTVPPTMGVPLADRGTVLLHSSAGPTSGMEDGSAHKPHRPKPGKPNTDPSHAAEAPLMKIVDDRLPASSVIHDPPRFADILDDRGAGMGPTEGRGSGMGSNAPNEALRMDERAPPSPAQRLHLDDMSTSPEARGVPRSEGGRREDAAMGSAAAAAAAGMPAGGSQSSAAGGHCFKMEGMDVIFFDKEGKARATWVFRDPMVGSPKLIQRCDGSQLFQQSSRV
ncbi:MAG: hypothetical protein WDW38_010616 [Sanguina aurantia]